MSYSWRSGSVLNVLGGGGWGAGPVPPRTNPAAPGLSFLPASHSSRPARLSQPTGCSPSWSILGTQACWPQWPSLGWSSQPPVSHLFKTVPPAGQGQRGDNEAGGGGPCGADLLTQGGTETSGAGRVQGASRGHGGLTISPRTSFSLQARERGLPLPQRQCPRQRVSYMPPCSPPNPPGLSGIKPHPSCAPRMERSVWNTVGG